MGIEYEVLEFLRQKLKERREKLTPEQDAFLERLYPNLNRAKEKTLMHAINLCDRTIVKNEKGRKPVEK